MNKIIISSWKLNFDIPWLIYYLYRWWQKTALWQALGATSEQALLLLVILHDVPYKQSNTEMLIEHEYLRGICFLRIYKSNLSLCLPGICLRLFPEGLEDSTKMCRHLLLKPASMRLGHWKKMSLSIFRESYLMLAQFLLTLRSFTWGASSVCEPGRKPDRRQVLKVSETMC